MTDTPSWRIDPETLNLVGPAGPPEGYTASQFAAQVWPACSVCGSMIQVDALTIDSKLGSEPTYLPGPWRCPRGCNRNSAGPSS
ncbi:MAG: hypothetical protein ACRDTG_19920 [Pseudonocardiaceae bacterium]